MTTEEAVLALRGDPGQSELVRDAYLGADVVGNAERFLASGEFAAVLALVAGRVQGGAVLDVGAGTGIASYAFARSGAREVVALEPDPSEVIGQGAIRRLVGALPIRVEGGWGEALPFADGRFDVVYLRQVLHHARDLDALVRECARVAARGGVVIATREHVVDDDRQLAQFLAAHPLHRLAGGEHAFALPTYVAAFRKAGLARARVLGPLDSVVNTYPTIADEATLRRHPAAVLERYLGVAGGLVARLPGATFLVRRAIDRPVPGRLYSFVGWKT